MNPNPLPLLNQKLFALAPHPSKKISDSIRGRTDVLDLTVGVPDYGPPVMLHHNPVAGPREEQDEALRCLEQFLGGMD